MGGAGTIFALGVASEWESSSGGLCGALCRILDSYVAAHYVA